MHFFNFLLCLVAVHFVLIFQGDSISFLRNAIFVWFMYWQRKIFIKNIASCDIPRLCLWTGQPVVQAITWITNQMPMHAVTSAIKWQNKTQNSIKSTQNISIRSPHYALLYSFLLFKVIIHFPRDLWNRRVSQMRVLLAACRELAVGNKT